MSDDEQTTKYIRNYIRLSQTYYEHPVIMACADEVPAALHLWPILIAKGRAGYHARNNPEGAITTTLNRLARDAYVSIDDVGPALSLLEDGDLVLLSAEGRNVVRIVVPRLFPWQTAPGSSAETSDHNRANASREKAPERDSSVTTARQGRDTEREGEREEEKGINPPVGKEPTKQAANIQNVFDYWIRVEAETGGMGSTGKGRPPKLTKERRAKINQRLNDGYTPADLKMAIAFYARDPHHSGDNDRSTRFTDLTTTLKNGAKVEAGVAGYESRGRLTPSGIDLSKWGA